MKPSGMKSTTLNAICGSVLTPSRAKSPTNASGSSCQGTPLVMPRPESPLGSGYSVKQPRPST